MDLSEKSLKNFFESNKNNRQGFEIEDVEACIRFGLFLQLALSLEIYVSSREIFSYLISVPFIFFAHH